MKKAHFFPNIADFVVELVSELSTSFPLSILSSFLLLLFYPPPIFGFQYDTTSLSSNYFRVEVKTKGEILRDESVI